MHDEGPSAEDLARFGGESGYCPECGAEVHDDAGHCPECGEPLTGGPVSRPPGHLRARRTWIVIIAVILVLALLRLLL